MITLNNWREGEPNNWGGGEDCLANHLFSRQQINDEACDTKYCPLCQLQFRKERFQLRGVCREVSEVDRFYELTRRDELLGISVSKMILNQDRSRWEIVSFSNETLLAFTSNADFPLGVRPWQFVPPLNCSDPGTEGTHRTLNLHRDLPEPGNFCCDFGTCISSSLVCNNVRDCEDNSDEEDCRLVIFPPHYRRHLPPVHVGDGRKEKLQINATITVIDVIDIIEDESSIDIDFWLLLTWFDKVGFIESPLQNRVIPLNVKQDTF